KAFADALGARRLPLTLLVEAAGLIQHRHSGYPAETRMRDRWLERLGWQMESLLSLARREAARPARRR
nr:hypothetical protein [Gemmatimonadota bacterium]